MNKWIEILRGGFVISWIYFYKSLFLVEVIILNTLFFFNSEVCIYELSKEIYPKRAFYNS